MHVGLLAGARRAVLDSLELLTFADVERDMNAQELRAAVRVVPRVTPVPATLEDVQVEQRRGPTGASRRRHVRFSSLAHITTASTAYTLTAEQRAPLFDTQAKARMRV
jgi:hypothetical protein